MTTIRVRYLVGAHLFADVLAWRVADEPDLEFGRIDTMSDEALAGTDVLLVDQARGPGCDLDRLDGRSGAPTVIVLGAHDDPEAAVTAARRGAAAWLEPTCTADELLLVVRRVLAGHAFYPRHMQAVVLRALRAEVHGDREPGPLDRLTRRERQVLTTLAEGMDNRCVADALSMSYNTVRTHVNEIFRKLGVHNRVEAVGQLVDAHR